MPYLLALIEKHAAFKFKLELFNVYVKATEHNDHDYDNDVIPHKAIDVKFFMFSMTTITQQSKIEETVDR